MKQYLFTFVLLLVTIILLLAFPARSLQFFRVSGNSMEPSLKDGQRILVRMARGTNSDFRHNDIVLLLHPETNRLAVKRIVATPLQSIETLDQLDIPLENALRLHTRLPLGYYAVLGDNVAKSQDSRHFGLIHEDAIRGRVIGIRQWGK